jgi:porin
MSSNEKRDLTFAVYDSNNRVNKLGFKDLFTDGMTFFGSANLITNLFGKKGKQGIAGAISTKEVQNLNDLDNFFPPTGNYIAKKSNRWSLSYFFEQTIYQNPDVKDQSFGIFGQAGLTDGKGTFTNFYFNVGISGDSPLTKRKQDRWGIGYFYYTFSDGLSEFRAPMVPGIFPGLAVNERESGLEAYYEAQITPWMSLGINYQHLTPGITEAFGNRNTNSSYLGFRSVVKL